jgi:hypothetical protein
MHILPCLEWVLNLPAVNNFSACLTSITLLGHAIGTGFSNRVTYTYSSIVHINRTVVGRRIRIEYFKMILSHSVCPTCIYKYTVKVMKRKDMSLLRKRNCSIKFEVVAGTEFHIVVFCVDTML